MPRKIEIYAHDNGSTQYRGSPNSLYKWFKSIAEIADALKIYFEGHPKARVKRFNRIELMKKSMGCRPLNEHEHTELRTLLGAEMYGERFPSIPQQ